MLDLKNIILARKLFGGSGGGGDTYLNATITNGKITQIQSNVTKIGHSAFKSCSSLTSINLPSAKSIGFYAFESCTSLTSANLPLATNIDSYAFENTSLTSIDLPNATIIGERAFYGCTSLTSINLPSVATICDDAFTNTSLTSIDLPNATTIGVSAFINTSLTSVDLPLATHIGEYAFCGTSLDTLILRSNTMCNINLISILDTNIASGDGTPTGQGFIYVPRALIEQYVANFVQQIVVGFGLDEATAEYMARAILRAIEDYEV